MLIAGLLTLSLTENPGVPPALIDEPLATYYSRALNTESSEPQKSLAMLKNLLLPESVSVSVSLDNVPEDHRTEFRRGFDRGMNLWKVQLGSDMPFRLARQGEDADIKVSFVNKVPGAGSSCKGEIRTKRQIQWNDKVHYFAFTAEIDAAKFATSDRLMSEDELTHVFAHELGHALGLGDVPGTGFIMGPIQLGSPTTQFADAEVEAVREFRKILRAQIDRITAKLGKSLDSTAGSKVVTFKFER